MKKRHTKRVTKERDDTMSATAVNYVYEVKDRNSMMRLNKSTVSKEMKERCKEAAKKYPTKR